MGVASTVMKMLSKGAKKSKVPYANMRKAPVDMPTKAKGKISKAKGELAKRTNEMKHMDKDDSTSYKKVISTGVKKQSDRTKQLKTAKKPGMSPSYKKRKALNKRLSNVKRNMLKNGYKKELADEVSELQEEINKSYGK